MKKNKMMSYLLIFGFLLGIQNGQIALWEDGKTEPRVFPYRAELLPEADRRALEKGIAIADKEELARLVEDYLS